MVGSASPLVVLTRPAGKNDALNASLRAQGFQVLVLPVLQVQTVTPPRQGFPLAQDFDLVMFVSSAALSSYLAQYGQQIGDAPLHHSVGPKFLAAVGPSTANALRASGWPSSSVILEPSSSVSFDSEGLWHEIQRVLPQIQNALIVRGQEGRNWLSDQLESSGVNVTRFTSYVRCDAQWSSEQLAILRAMLPSRGDGAPDSVWLMTSRHSVDALFALLARHACLGVLSRARFVAVHERVAEHLKFQFSKYCSAANEPAVTLCAPDNASMLNALVATATQ